MYPGSLWSDQVVQFTVFQSSPVVQSSSQCSNPVQLFNRVHSVPIQSSCSVHSSPVVQSSNSEYVWLQPSSLGTLQENYNDHNSHNNSAHSQYGHCEYSLLFAFFAVYLPSEVRGYPNPHPTNEPSIIIESLFTFHHNLITLAWVHSLITEVARLQWTLGLCIQWQSYSQTHLFSEMHGCPTKHMFDGGNQARINTYGKTIHELSDAIIGAAVTALPHPMLFQKASIYSKMCYSTHYTYPRHCSTQCNARISHLLHDLSQTHFVLAATSPWLEFTTIPLPIS
jgi:hypothetical protein